MANIIKLLPGLENGSIQFNRINTSPEEYTNVHTVLFNGDQEGFEITTDSSGGFTKLVDSVSIDWQGAQMPNTAQLLGLVNGISLNNTAQLIDIIERICAKLNDGGIPEPPEPEEPVIDSITINGSTNIERFYKESYTPVIKANMSDGTQRPLNNDELTWYITSDTESLSLTGAKVTCIKIGTGILTGILNSDNTKTIIINITIKPVDIGSNKVSLDGVNNSIPWELDQIITQNTIVLKYSNFETLIENIHYTVEYANNICTEENQYVDTTATITFRAKDNSNYTGVRTQEFIIKGQEQQVEYYWYCGQPIEQGENTVQILENVYIPTINENSIVDETNEYSTLTGWRKITQSSYTANNPLYSTEMTGRNGVKSIYVDGFDSETGEKLNQSVEYYMLIPTNTNILVRDSFGPISIYYENVLINDIAYNIYKATARKCVYEIY